MASSHLYIMQQLERTLRNQGTGATSAAQGVMCAAVVLYVSHVQVYEGVAAMHSRDFKRAAELLLDSIATFTT
jgi:hypothetical protein